MSADVDLDATPEADQLQPRRVALIAGLTVASFVIVALLTLLVSTGGGGTDAADEEFLAACRRSDAPQDRCQCALEEWNRTLDADARAELDDALADGEAVPADLVSALARC